MALTPVPWPGPGRRVGGGRRTFGCSAPRSPAPRPRLAQQQSRVSCGVAGCKPAQRTRPVRTDTVEACWIDSETERQERAPSRPHSPSPNSARMRVDVLYTASTRSRPDTPRHISRREEAEAGRAHRLSETRRAEPCRDALSSRHATKPSHHETNPSSWLRANLLGGGGGAVPSSSLDFRSASASVALPARPQRPLSIRPLSQPKLENVLDGS